MLSFTANAGYFVLWRYSVPNENRTRFEKEYGSDGTWSRCFRKSPDYKGSYLQKSCEDPNTYLLFDTWTNQAAYTRFMSENKQEYDVLSQSFAGLYSKEERLGAYGN